MTIRIAAAAALTGILIASCGGGDTAAPSSPTQVTVPPAPTPVDELPPEIGEQADRNVIAIVEEFEQLWNERILNAADGMEPAAIARSVALRLGGIVVGDGVQLVEGQTTFCVELGEAFRGPLTYTPDPCPVVESADDIDLDLEDGALYGYRVGETVDVDSFVAQLTTKLGDPDIDTLEYTTSLSADEPENCFANTARRVFVWDDLIVTIGSWDQQEYRLWEWTVGNPDIWIGRFTYPAVGVPGTPWAVGPENAPITAADLTPGLHRAGGVALGDNGIAARMVLDMGRWMELQEGLLWTEHAGGGYPTSGYLLIRDGIVAGFGNTIDGC